MARHKPVPRRGARSKHILRQILYLLQVRLSKNQGILQLLDPACQRGCLLSRGCRPVARRPQLLLQAVPLPAQSLVLGVTPLRCELCFVQLHLCAQYNSQLPNRVTWLHSAERE